MKAYLYIADEQGLNPYISLLIIAVSLWLIASTGQMFFTQNRVCVTVPLTRVNEVNVCMGTEPQRYVPLPTLISG